MTFATIVPRDPVLPEGWASEIVTVIDDDGLPFLLRIARNGGLMAMCDDRLARLKPEGIERQVAALCSIQRQAEQG